MLDTIQVNNSNTQQRHPMLTREQLCSLPNDAKITWDLLSDEAKRIIIEQKPPQPTQRCPPPSRRSVNQAEISYLMSCLHDPPNSPATDPDDAGGCSSACS